MKIGFLYPCWTGTAGWIGRISRRAASWPPINLALLAAICEREGHEAFIVDGQAEDLSQEELVHRALALQPDVIGLSATSPFFHFQIDVAERIRRLAPHVKIIIGGPHITIMRGGVGHDCFDALFVGEAEYSLPEYLSVLQSGGDPCQVKGLVLPRNGTWVPSGEARKVEDFDSLPWPARHLLNMAAYRLGTPDGYVPFSSIQTTRGCPWKCIFCASQALDTTNIRRRSPESVVQEMKHVVETWGARHFYIVDDVLTLHSEHIVRLCELLDAEGLKVTFEGGTRANLINDALAARMVASGMRRLSFGLESANLQVRDIMKKKVPLHYYVEANRILNNHGVEAINSVMIGLPGDTRETVKETIDMLARCKHVKLVNFAIAVPYPGTEFHDMAISGGHGIQLHTTDFANYQRYGTAVTTVNGLEPQDLADLQNEAFVRIYMQPFRWPAMLRKFGAFGAIMTFVRALRLVRRRLLGKTRSAADAIVDGGHMGSPTSPNG